eukprot:SAG31_NODE_2761_length_5132_cov_12.543016_1_plen_369_part_00
MVVVVTYTNEEASSAAVSALQNSKMDVSALNVYELRKKSTLETPPAGQDTDPVPLLACSQGRSNESLWKASDAPIGVGTILGAAVAHDSNATTVARGSSTGQAADGVATAVMATTSTTMTAAPVAKSEPSPPVSPPCQSSAVPSAVTRTLEPRPSQISGGGLGSALGPADGFVAAGSSAWAANRNPLNDRLQANTIEQLQAQHDLRYAQEIERLQLQQRRLLQQEIDIKRQHQLARERLLWGIHAQQQAQQQAQQAHQYDEHQRVQLNAQEVPFRGLPWAPPTLGQQSVVGQTPGSIANLAPAAATAATQLAVTSQQPLALMQSRSEAQTLQDLVSQQRQLPLQLHPTLLTNALPPLAENFQPKQEFT